MPDPSPEGAPPTIIPSPWPGIVWDVPGYSNEAVVAFYVAETRPLVLRPLIMHDDEVMDPQMLDRGTGEIYWSGD